MANIFSIAGKAAVLIGSMGQKNMFKPKEAQRPSVYTVRIRPEFFCTERKFRKELNKILSSGPTWSSVLGVVVHYYPDKMTDPESLRNLFSGFFWYPGGVPEHSRFKDIGLDPVSVSADAVIEVSSVNSRSDGFFGRRVMAGYTLLVPEAMMDKLNEAKTVCVLSAEFSDGEIDNVYETIEDYFNRLEFYKTARKKGDISSGKCHNCDVSFAKCPPELDFDCYSCGADVRDSLRGADRGEVYIDFDDDDEIDFGETG